MVIKYNFKDKSLLGITLFPFILINKWLYDKPINDISLDVIINHEKIHLKQQLEMLILPFYIWYLFEYLIRYIHYKRIFKWTLSNIEIWNKAYQNISFEREAYKHERNLNYLHNRKLFSWFKYLQFKNYNKW